MGGDQRNERDGEKIDTGSSVSLRSQLEFGGGCWREEIEGWREEINSFDLNDVSTLLRWYLSFPLSFPFNRSLEEVVVAEGGEVREILSSGSL